MESKVIQIEFPKFSYSKCPEFNIKFKEPEYSVTINNNITTCIINLEVIMYIFGIPFEYNIKAVGIAKCNPKDVYNKEKGIKIALCRAKIKALSEFNPIFKRNMEQIEFIINSGKTKINNIIQSDYRYLKYLITNNKEYLFEYID